MKIYKLPYLPTLVSLKAFSRTYTGCWLNLAVTSSSWWT